MSESDAPSTRCGFAALVGAPNAGKSTLVNALVGAKVSIVSRKAQTTRAQVRGVMIEGLTQIVLVDTPGIFAPKRRLDRAMVASALSGAKDADLNLLIVDARKGADAEVSALIQQLIQSPAPKWLVLNKVDVVARERLLALAKELNEAQNFEETFMISAQKGDGLDRLRTRLAPAMPLSPWLY
ncbi:MAG: GTPase Era, partial [Methylocystis sp.]